MRNLRLDLCYDGTRYRGWQRLKGEENTLQGKLEQCLSRILGEEIEISGSGRTDAGVHARGQVASFHTESDLPAEEILSQLRRYLPEDVGIYSCKDCSPRFHARLSAKEKTYVAADVVGAGIGELVLVVSGSTARQAFGRDDVPADMAIVGIIDSLEIDRSAK